MNIRIREINTLKPIAIIIEQTSIDTSTADRQYIERRCAGHETYAAVFTKTRLYVKVHQTGFFKG
jgi:hypothetical protein